MKKEWKTADQINNAFELVNLKNQFYLHCKSVRFEIEVKFRLNVLTIFNAFVYVVVFFFSPFFFLFFKSRVLDFVNYQRMHIICLECNFKCSLTSNSWEIPENNSKRCAIVNCQNEKKKSVYCLANEHFTGK